VGPFPYKNKFPYI